MESRNTLCEQEDIAWEEFHQLVAGFRDSELEDPGVTPDGWSVKDVMFHVGAWLADCGLQFERMRAGTFQEPELDTDAINREWFELSRTLDLQTVRAELMSSRNRMLQTFAAIGELTPAAIEWFEESGPIHYRLHADDLRRWMRRRGI
jgi:DinB family protein